MKYEFLQWLASARSALAALNQRIFTRFDRTPPQVSVWYGERQTFGKGGLSQNWVNVLGNAADPESGIRSLTCSLNGGKVVDISLGPDDRRLHRPGDFNVDLDPAQLKHGANHLIITATNGRGLQTSLKVKIQYDRRDLTLPYQIDWGRVHNAQDVLQIVDGKWRWDENGIRTVEVGYDRVLSVGDMRWTDYQVTVEVTVHGFDQAAFVHKNGGRHAAIAVDLRWTGHTNHPVRCEQPLCGWNPVGNSNRYYFMPDGHHFLALKIRSNGEDSTSQPYVLEIGHSYTFKASVQTALDGNVYRFKVWEQGIEPEPVGWMFESIGIPGPPPEGNPDRGAIVLVAHHSDVTFGSILVEALPEGNGLCRNDDCNLRYDGHADHRLAGFRGAGLGET